MFVLAWFSGFFDIALVVADRGSVFWEGKTRSVDSLYVIVAGIDQLELQIVGR